MVSSELLLFLSTIFIFTSPAVAQSTFLGQFCNHTASSTYEANVDHLLRSFYTNTEINYGFYNSTYGQNSDKVYAIGLCRGDATPDICRRCLQNATSLFKKLCPNKKEGIGWLDYCTLRYSNRSIFGLVETDQTIFVWNTKNVTAQYVDSFKSNATSLLGSLMRQAAVGGSLRKFAANRTSGPDNLTIYGLVQCQPDLSELQCTNCFGWALNAFPLCCDRRIGGRVLGPSCNFRYETNQFYDLTAYPPSPSSSETPPISPAPPSTNTNTTKGSKSKTTKTAIVVIVPIVAFLVLAISICVYFRVRRPTKRLEIAEEITSTESLQFDFDTIQIATNYFSEENKLGQGGFGVVYKGKLLDGQDIAVKRLSKNSEQGDLEFKNEVLLVAKLQHRNLTRLLGFCLEGNERLLVYEFVPNKSLDHFLFDPTSHALLDWEIRYNIIGGIAKGVLYLHEDSRLRIIHRDLKASNILLDAKMNPKISDFGMAKLFLLDQTQETSRIVGTYGYMAPEYAMQGNFSTKSDVFSFGVLMLEIVSGRRNNSFQNGEDVEDLLSYAWKNWRAGTTSNIIDPRIRLRSTNEVIRCIHIGLLCVQENATNRPTMASVVLMLNSYSTTLPAPSKPAFFVQSNIDSEASPQEHGIRVLQFSANEASISELDPR